MVRTAFIVLLIAYLPGALIFRLPLGERSRRAALSAEERVFWAVVISVALSSIVGFALAATGSFQLERLILVNGGISLTIGLLWRLKLRFGGEAPRPTWTAGAPLVLLLLAAGTFFLVPPAEYINGGRDPAVYFNSGIQIAQRGSLLIDDPLVRSVPPQHRELFFGQDPPDVSFDISRFTGFYVLDQDAGTVVGQFPHLYPVWIAIAYETYGLTGARYVHGLWGVLGVLAVYLTGAALFGRRAAFAGAALLAVNVAQVWFARYFCVEMIFQALVFAGVLAYIRAHVDGDRFFAPIAGILIGLTPFLHITGVVAIGALGLAALLGRCGGQRFLASFALPLVVAAGLAAVYYLTVLETYTPFWYFGRLRPEHVAAIVGVLAVVALAFAAGRPAFAAQVRRWLPPVATAALWILAAYALFIRVKGGLPATRDPAALYPEGLYSYTFYYLQPLGLAAALTGWAVVSRRRFWPSWGFLAVAAAFAVVVFYDPHITPDHFWAGRRYVSVILPASLLLIGAAAFTPAPLPEWPGLAWTRGPVAARLRLAAGVVLVAALGWQYVQATRPILRHVEHAGVIPTVEQLAGRFTPDDLLLFGNRGVTDAQAFALPLAYVYGRNVLSLREWEPDPQLLRQFLDWARTRYARVFFIGGATALHTSRTGAALVSREQTRIPHYDRTLNAYPNGVVNWELNYGIYDLLVDPPPPGPFDLDVGGDDDLQVLGMHPRTVDPRGVTYRWTTATSIVWVVGTLPDAREVTLRMSSGGRPEAAGVAEVRISLNDQPLGSITVPDDRFRPYAVTIPPELAQAIAASEGAAELRIETVPWVPLHVLGIPDQRELGVMLDRVEVR